MGSHYHKKYQKDCENLIREVDDLKKPIKNLSSTIKNLNNTIQVMSTTIEKKDEERILIVRLGDYKDNHFYSHMMIIRPDRY